MNRYENMKERCGTTMIEVLVCVTIIILLSALIVPAVQSVRESARKLSCSNNLRQLSLSVSSYADSNNVFPIGAFMMRPPGNPDGGDASCSHEQSLWIQTLLYTDYTLFSSYNFNVHYTFAENISVNATAISTLWCPSDPDVSRRANYEFQSSPMQRTSYMANSGTWASPGRCQDNSSPVFSSALGQAYGVVYFYSKVAHRDISDGASNTFLLAESAFGPLSDADKSQWHWWSSGNYSDTMFTTLLPPNPFTKYPKARMGTGGDSGIDNRFTSAASSMHPGGCHFAFCDGSVSFIKETIQSWPIDAKRMLPVGVTVSRNPYSGNIYKLESKFGVYQSLSTRAGSETIGAY